MKLTLKDERLLSLFGHIVVANHQIHSYQIKYIRELLLRNALSEHYYLIDNVFSDDSEISLDEALVLYQAEDRITREAIFYHAAIIAYLDGGLLDSDEDRIFLALEAGLDASKEEISELAFAQYKLKLRNYQAEAKQKDSLIQDQLSPELYDEIMEIGRDDFNYLQGLLDKIKKQTDTVLSDLSKVEDGIQSDYTKKQATDLLELGDATRESITKKMARLESEVIKKERSLNYFTISFLGRTKAGKSTLHAILTGEGEEEIGKGKQRTTRYNRVYEKGHIRIIDTPGIEAAEEDGRKDEEIAEGIISESDIVCILVADDNVSVRTIDLAERIARNNKPVNIVLNHKKNITSEVRMKHFMKNPFAWVDASNRDVYGHIEKIERDVRERGIERLVTVHPIFLLPAKIAMEGGEYGSILYKSSNIEVLRDRIMQQISGSGTVLRSRTMLDHTRKTIDDMRLDAEADVANRQGMIKEMETNLDDIERKLDLEKFNFLEQVEYAIKEHYGKIRQNYVWDFADANYDYKSKKQKVDKLWGDYIGETELNQELEAKIIQDTNIFISKVKEIVSDQIESLEIASADYNISIGGFGLDFFTDPDNIEHAMTIINIGTKILLLAGKRVPPLTIPLTVLDFAGGFFKKEKKDKPEANPVNDLYKNIIDGLAKQESSHLKDINKQLTREIEKSYKDFAKQYKLVVGLFDKQRKNLDKLAKFYSKQTGVLDIQYGLRILDFIAISKNENKQLWRHISGIDREFGKTLVIKTGKDFLYSQDKLEILEEDVKIVGGVKWE